MNLRDRIKHHIAQQGHGELQRLATAIGCPKTSLHSWLHRIPKRPEFELRVEEAFRALEAGADPEQICEARVIALSKERDRIQAEIDAIVADHKAAAAEDLE